MSRQLQFDIGNGDSRVFHSADVAQEGAKRYTEGRHNTTGLETVQANPRRGHQIQAAYKEAQAAPTEAPGIRKSYEAMRSEVHRQHAFMTSPKESGGMGLRHEVVDEDPYPTPQAMAEDVRGGTIKTFSTKSTGGHEFFSDEDNDKFRAVHDVFGHAAIGRGFSRNGEEAAYLSHRQMFPKAAQAALASETRGQNSFLNYGATMGDPEKKFPDQSSKLIGLPAVARKVRR
jgi:hypothetical protein